MIKPLLLSDLIPRRSATYVLLFAGGVSIILVLGALYGLGFRLAGLTTDGQVAAFDLDHEGSIASWFSIVLLFMCGLVTLLIRALRSAGDGSRRECRTWIGVGLLWFCMSLDEGASLHEGFKEAMARVTGTRIFGDGSIYWALPYFVLLSIAGLFLLSRAWRNLPALICLVSAGIAYGMAAAGQLDLILPGRPVLETWMEESCEMLADLCMLLCLTLHARSIAFETESKASAEFHVAEPHFEKMVRIRSVASASSVQCE